MKYRNVYLRLILHPVICRYQTCKCPAKRQSYLQLNLRKQILYTYRLFSFLVGLLSFILSKHKHILEGLSNSLTLCSKLLERYHEVEYILINDMANIDKGESTGKSLIYVRNISYRLVQISHNMIIGLIASCALLIGAVLTQMVFSFSVNWMNKTIWSNGRTR